VLLGTNHAFTPPGQFWKAAVGQFSKAPKLTNREDGESIVFSISSAIWPGELDPTLSRCVEKLALTLDQWLAEPAASSVRNSHRAIPSL